LGEPAWAPDGSALAFVNHTDIWVAPASDLDLPIQITNDAAFERSLSWSPDSSRIAFEREASSDHQRDLYSVEPDDSNVQRLTTNIAVDGHPTWSPDGKKIAFFSERVHDGAIYVMNGDGSNETRLTPRGSGGWPLWQPCPSTCASVIEHERPSSTITSPVDGDSYTPSQIKSFTGTAADEPSGVRGVYLSLRRRAADGSCRWWNGDRFRSGPCDEAGWVHATGHESWTYDLPARLPRSPGDAVYRLRSRALDRSGNTEKVWVAGVNQVKFDVE
jgi:dipeptidyl aminopeptidase/acylaminoacyl peptidase